MKLELEGRPAIEDAQANDVIAAVSELALPAHSFLILSRARSSYVQVAMQADERFVVEYREGRPPGFRSAREDHSRGEVGQLLESYLAGGVAWRGGIRWRAMGGKSLRDPLDTVSLVSASAALAILLMFVLSSRAPREPGTPPADPMAYLAISMLVLLPSLLIDVRRFKTMSAGKRFKTIMTLLVVAMVLVIYCLERGR